MGIVIFGTSEFSEYLYYTIKLEADKEVLAFTLSKKYLKDRFFCDLPVIEFEDLPNLLVDPFEILISVGYHDMNKGREKIYKQCKKLGYRVASFISTRAICDSKDIGEGCIVMPKAYVPPITSLGVCNVINVATILGHTSVIGDFNWFSGNVTMGGNVKVDNNCFIGMNCLIKNGIHVRSFALIGAYSFLNDNTLEGRFYSGNPAVNTKGLKSMIVCDFI